MARILISYFSDYGEAMYDAISMELIKSGNDVFRFNINNKKIVTCDSWGGSSKIIDQSFESKIVSFAPEVVLNFNHSLPNEIVNILVDSNCKICILDADNPETFWNKETLLLNKDRYYYLGFQRCSKKLYEDFLKISLNESGRYLFFPPGTIVKNEKLKKNHEISFIGSNFYPLSIPYDERFYSEQALLLVDKFRENYFYSYSDAKSSWPELDEKLFEIIRGYYVGQERLKSLGVLSDLGLVIYGLRWWRKIAYYDFEISASFDDEVVASIEENQRVYNSSKIAVNISHPQAISSFSWRVMDIMASGACLLMESKSDWYELFGHLLSDKVKKHVIYEDRFDMRNKAQILLLDEGIRQECVDELNSAIEKNGRWKHRFFMLSDFLNTSICNSEQQGKIVYFVESCEEVNGVTRDESIYKRINRILYGNISGKARFKNALFFIILAIGQVPILGKLLPEITRKKMMNRIYSY